MMRDFKAILFDCDGVLLDSEPLGCESLARAVSAAGRPMTTVEAASVFSGNSVQASLAWIAGEGLDPEQVVASADEILFAMFDMDIPHIPGVEAVLRGFDLPMAVCSNSSINRLEQSLARTPLAAHFGPHIYSAEQVARGKPAPDLVYFAAEKLRVAPAEAIFIDDNPHGVKAAVAAGCLAVGFVGPSDHRAGHAEVLRAAGADHVVSGMAAFHELLTRLSVPVAA